MQLFCAGLLECWGRGSGWSAVGCGGVHGGYGARARVVRYDERREREREKERDF